MAPARNTDSRQDKHRQPKYRLNAAQDHICFRASPSLKTRLAFAEDFIGDYDHRFEALSQPVSERPRLWGEYFSRYGKKTYYEEHPNIHATNDCTG